MTDKTVDFWTPRHVARKRDEPELIAAYRRERQRKKYEDTYASLHWCEWNNDTPDGEEVSYGPSVEAIWDMIHRAYAIHGDEFDPEFRTKRSNKYSPLNFN